MEVVAKGETVALVEKVVWMDSQRQVLLRPSRDTTPRNR